MCFRHVFRSSIPRIVEAVRVFKAFSHNHDICMNEQREFEVNRVSEKGLRDKDEFSAEVGI